MSIKSGKFVFRPVSGQKVPIAKPVPRFFFGGLRGRQKLIINEDFGGKRNSLSLSYCSKAVGLLKHGFSMNLF